MKTVGAIIAAVGILLFVTSAFFILQIRYSAPNHPTSIYESRYVERGRAYYLSADQVHILSILQQTPFVGLGIVVLGFFVFRWR